jgi:hypothetical protein
VLALFAGTLLYVVLTATKKLMNWQDRDQNFVDRNRACPCQLGLFGKIRKCGRTTHILVIRSRRPDAVSPNKYLLNLSRNRLRLRTTTPAILRTYGQTYNKRVRINRDLSFRHIEVRLSGRFGFLNFLVLCQIFYFSIFPFSYPIYSTPVVAL